MHENDNGCLSEPFTGARGCRMRYTTSLGDGGNGPIAELTDRYGVMFATRGGKREGGGEK